jgi:hypothetical protein
MPVKMFLKYQGRGTQKRSTKRPQYDYRKRADILKTPKLRIMTYINEYY